jgi:hypothetical protein
MDAKDGDRLELKDLPRDAPLRVLQADINKMVDATMHKLDGSFSYCTIVGDIPARGQLQRAFHLHVLTPLHMVDGRWEILKEET